MARGTGERLMTADGLHRVIWGAKIKTTKPDVAVPRPEDLVERQFTALRPNRWGSRFLMTRQTCRRAAV